LNIDTSLINVTSFENASEVFSSEGHSSEGWGLSFYYEACPSAWEIVQDVMVHCRSTLVWKDGKIYWVTVRRPSDGYGTYPTVQEEHITPGSFRISRPSWEVTNNAVVVSYSDREREYQQNAVQVVDNANLALTKRFRRKKFVFEGITDSHNAASMAQWLLTNSSYPLSEIQFTSSRYSETLAVGEPFTLNYSPSGISNAVYRCRDIGEDAIESSTYRVTAVEEPGSLVTMIDYTPPGISTPGTTYDVTFPGVTQAYITEYTSDTYMESDIPVYVFAGLPDEDFWVGIRPYDSLEQDGEYTRRQAMESYGILGNLRTALPTNPEFDVDGVIEVNCPTWIELSSVDQSGFQAGDLALDVGGEVIYAKTSTAQSYGYSFTNLIRNRWDTGRVSHSAGEQVTLLTGVNVILYPMSYNKVRVYYALTGRYFVLNRYIEDDYSNAYTANHKVRNKANRPYTVENPHIQGNDPKYDEAFSGLTVTITWNPRSKTGGAGEGGAGDEDTDFDSYEEDIDVTRINVYKLPSGDLLRSAGTGAGVTTYSYTKDMCDVDDGAGWAGIDDFKFRIRQKRNGQYSEPMYVIARK
jgi:hypothetical protein